MSAAESPTDKDASVGVRENKSVKNGSENTVERSAMDESEGSPRLGHRRYHLFHLGQYLVGRCIADSPDGCLGYPGQFCHK